MKAVETWKQRARQLETETYAVYLACKHPGTPRCAKLFAACVVGYAFSPIDLIPDFVPLLGYLDDLLLVPLGIALALRMIPPDVLAECRAKAQEAVGRDRLVNRTAAVVVVAIWLLLAALVIVLAVRVVSACPIVLRASGKVVFP